MIQFRFDMSLILMGFYGGIMVLAVLILRMLLGKWLPKRVTPVLWALVLVRLLVPFSISSPLSLPVPTFLGDLSYSYAEGMTYMTFQESEPATAILTEGSAFGGVVISNKADTNNGPLVDYGMVMVDDIEEQKRVALEAHSKEVMDRIMNQAVQVEVTHGLGDWFWYDPWEMGFSGIWLVGMAVMALVLCWRYFHSRRGFQGVYELDENQIIRQTLVRCRVNARAYSCDTAKSPVVVGLFQPMILLPASLDFSNEELVRHILTHEAMHIRRRDNLVKLVMMAALCLHWYNPLVWVMAREFCRDMESACDEAALAQLGAEESAPYAESLLAMAVPGLSGGLFASAFSRTEVERRVKGVLAYKKPGFFTLTAAAVLLLSVTVAFATCGQAAFDDYLSDWCYDDGDYVVYSGGEYIIKATLNRPIDLGDSWNYARSRANGAIYQGIEDHHDVIRRTMETYAERGKVEDPYQEPQNSLGLLEQMIQARLSEAFHAEPGAFKVQITPILNREKALEQYKEYGLERDEDGRWLMDGKEVHYLEDQVTGILYSSSTGEVDVYVIRDEQYRLLRIESYNYYRF